ncbi:MAG TPA: CBS domain-containing protein [Solirubrobacteraceae bacterium]|nr:CBS domain-containing protein [Solirubrobacteraceae bacterium]
MSPRQISELALQAPEPLAAGDTVEVAVRRVLDSGLPALPVVDDRARYAGIFGEREFMEAVFPGYLTQLKHAAFLPRSLDDALEKRDASRTDPVGRYMNTEHVDVGPDYADTQVAEIFLHHRVLVVPVVDDGRVVGLITRRDFFRAIAERFLALA